MKQGTMKRAGRLLAFFMALIMVCCTVVMPAAASSDWMDLVITLRWNNGESEFSSVAAPVAMAENTFWVQVDENALNSLVIDLYHPARSYQFDPASGSILQNVIPAGEFVDGSSCIMINAVDETGVFETYYLYISTVTPVPVLVTEEPTAEPTEEPTPEPTEEPTPEPTEEATPEPTEEPTPEPTEEPTPEPTEEPTPELTEEPTPEPTEEPTPEPTEEATSEPTLEPTLEPSQEPTWEPTEEPTAEPPVYTDNPIYDELPVESETPTDQESNMTGTVMIDRYGLTNIKKVNIRSGMSTSTSAVGQISNAYTYVYVISETVTENGEHWLYIRIDSVTGYIKADLIDILSPEENEAYLNSLYSGSIPDEPVEPKTPTDIPEIQTTEPEPSSDLSEQIDTDSQANDEGVTAQEETINEPYNNDAVYDQDPFEQVGYDTPLEPETELSYDIHDDIVSGNESSEGSIPESELTNTDFNEETDEQTAQTVEPIETPFVVETPIPAGLSINRIGTVTDKQVGFRTDMTANSALIKRFAKGSYVYVIVEKVNNAGENWYYVEDNGQFGYIKSNFIEVLTNAESESIMIGLWTSPAPEVTLEPAATPEITEEPEQTSAVTDEPETVEPVTQEPEYTPAPTPVETAIPAGTMINRFGMINAKQVAFREAMNTEKTPISRLAKGDYVYLLREETNAAGEEWYLIEVDGRDGYVMKKFVEVLSQTESDEVTEKECETPVPYYSEPGVTAEPYTQETAQNNEAETTPENESETEIAEQTSKEKETEQSSAEEDESQNPELQPLITEIPPQTTEETHASEQEQTDTTETEAPVTEVPTETTAPVETEVPASATTETVTELPTEIPPTETPTEAPTQIPTETPPVLTDKYSGYALVRQKTSLMSAPDAKVISELAPTTLVEVTDQAYASDQSVWSTVRTLDNLEGMVPDAVLSHISDENAKTLIDQWNVIHTTPTPAPTPAPTAEPEQISGYAVTLGNGVYMRNYPASAGVIRSELEGGKVLYVTGQFYENGTPWHQVYDEGVWGYVRADMLRMMNEDEVKAYTEKFVVTAEPVQVETPAPFTGESMSSYGYVTSTSASFRNAASKDADVIDSLRQYAFCLIQGVTNDGTQDWYKVWINGKEGYVSGNYFKQLTADELSRFLSSPEYQEGLDANSTDGHAINDPNAYILDAEDRLMDEWNDDNTGYSTESSANPYTEITPEPYQRQGYAITIGDGVYVRSYPDATSMILAELLANKVVYVIGQTYADGIAWHEVVNNGEWGYIRADMLRMMSESEVDTYINQFNNTPEPTPITTPEPYSGEDWSSYGYVESRSVNFREKPSTNSSKIGTLKQYAFCLILGIEANESQTWYKVWYNGQTGYVSGEYFKQLTVDEMNDFRQSKEYLKGVEDNKKTGTEASDAGTFVSAEDQTVRVWTNPNAGINVSYAPFDPFATPEPLVTATPEAVETDQYAQVTELTEEEPEETQTYNPLATTEPGEDHAEGSSAGTFLLVAAAVLLLGGGGYAAFMVAQNKKKAAQREAERRAKAARQNNATMNHESNTQRNMTAQDAARANRVRTGTYTNTAGTSVPSAVPMESSVRGTEKPLGNTGNAMYNPYGRYTTPKQDDTVRKQEITATERHEFEPVRTESAEHKPQQDTWQVNDNNVSNTPKRRRRTETYNHSDDDE